MSDSNQTTDHNTIKKWGEGRKGNPAIVMVKDTRTKDKNEGVPTIRFDEKTEKLNPVSRIFDERKVPIFMIWKKKALLINNKFIYSSHLK